MDSSRRSQMCLKLSVPICRPLQQAPGCVGVHQEQEQQPEKPSEADEIQKEGTEEHHRPLADELRKRLALEQEKTRQCAVHRITPN